MSKLSKYGYKFYDKNNNKLNIIGCFDCYVCKEWEKQPWKSRIFCPVHCYMCFYAGYDDEFVIFPKYDDSKPSLFLCLNCEKKAKEKIKNLFNHHLKLH